MITDKAAKIKRVFSDLNRKFEEQGTQRRAANWHLPYFDLTGFPIESQALAIVPQERAWQTGSIPFFKEGPLLKLGVTDPQNPKLKSYLAELSAKKYQVEVYLVSKSGFEEAAGQYKKILSTAVLQKHEVLVTSGEEVVKKLRSLPDWGERVASLSTTDLLSLIIGAAVTMRSSDIHLEPEKNALKIRFRIDGVLTDIAFLHPSIMAGLLARIKLLAGLKLNVSTPQDGRFSVKGKDSKVKDWDLRVSVLPAAYGEAVVIRILGVQEIALDIDQLGLRKETSPMLKEQLMKPNGMILTTGPTGSGKTTTLYAFLSYLNKPGVKIITLEDPVEYQLEGIIQTPIDKALGLDFAKGLRSILRQDPDIILVGEIRDYETAETACQAALTGHMVLSTLHTNDAAGAIPRLLDLGVKPVTLAPALSALIAQRLLRKICPACREVYQPDQKQLLHVQEILSQIPKQVQVKIPAKLTFYLSRGCKACHNLGYRGRIGVFEAFAIDEKVHQLIFDQASTFEIKKQAVAQGMLTMQQDGVLKALEGLTDLSEVWRVTEE